jgi:ubiquinone/menaquinone biosynthesis C-methylase UbiE
MPLDPRIAYHLNELEIARDPASPHRLMPELGGDDRTVLDIGCGIGQTLACLDADGRLFVGLDVDLQCLAFGHQMFPGLCFVHGTAERLPFRDRAFDLVLSRVSLPYTHIPRTLAEIERVLRPDGRVWLALHPPAMAFRELSKALRRFEMKNAFYKTYVVVNGVALHLLGRQFAFPWKRKIESFQSIAGMTKAMHSTGFTDVSFARSGLHLICTARKAEARFTSALSGVSDLRYFNGTGADRSVPPLGRR